MARTSMDVDVSALTFLSLEQLVERFPLPPTAAAQPSLVPLDGTKAGRAMRERRETLDRESRERSNDSAVDRPPNGSEIVAHARPQL